MLRGSLGSLGFPWVFLGFLGFKKRADPLFSITSWVRLAKLIFFGKSAPQEPISSDFWPQRHDGFRYDAHVFINA